MMTNEIQKALFNPLTTDFTWSYLDENNQARIAVMPAQEIAYFPPWLAERMIIHLTDTIINLRGIRDNAEDTKKRIQAEIEVLL